MATNSAAGQNLNKDQQKATQDVAKSRTVLEHARDGVGTAIGTSIVTEGVATKSKNGDDQDKVLRDDTQCVATNKTAPEATPNCVGDRNEVGTAHRPLNVAIGVATKEIRDMHCETLATIPQDGEVGSMTQCMADMNVELRVGTAVRPLTVETGAATQIDIEQNCPDIQAMCGH